MTEEAFRDLFRKAQQIAFVVAKDHVLDDLNEKFKFDIRMYQSHELSKEEKFDYYPEGEDMHFNNLSEEKIMKLLFRNGKVPVWIDINVKRVQNNYTIMNLYCSERFSDDPKEYYYEKGGTGPFGIKSPLLPIGFKPGIKFNL